MSCDGTCNGLASPGPCAACAPDDDVPVIHTGATAQRQGDEGWREAVARLPDGACVWCGGPTPLRSVPVFRPSLGPVPLHALCGFDMREAFLDYQQGRPFRALEAERRMAALMMKGASG